VSPPQYSQDNRCTSISHTGQAPLHQLLAIDTRPKPYLYTPQICPPSPSGSARRPNSLQQHLQISSHPSSFYQLPEAEGKMKKP